MNSAFSRDTFLDTQVAFSGFPYIPRTCTAFLHVVGLCYFRYLVIKLCVHPADALKILDFPETFTQTWGCFFWVLVHPEDAPEIPHFPGTFTQTQGFFLSGFPHITLCRCSGFSWDIYPGTGVVFFFSYSAHYIMQLLQLFLGHLHRPGSFFFGFSAHYIIQMLQFLLGHLHEHGGFFSLGFPHTTSCRCSKFAWDIYLETGVGFFGISTHYIIQMLQLFLGHLNRHGGCFLSDFLHTTSCRCSGFSWDIYPDTGVVLFRFS